MRKKEKRIVKFNAAADMPRDRTDWGRVKALTEAEIAKAAAEDADAAPLLDETWFKRAKIVYPPSKSDVHIKLDDVIVGWFKREARKTGGRGYQTRINAVLRAYVEAQSAPSVRVRKRA